MDKYTTLTADGLPTGFYDEAIHGVRMLPIEDTSSAGHVPNPACTIPAEAIAITDEQWMEFLSYQGQRRWDGMAVVPYMPPLPPATADDVNTERQRRIVAGRVVNGVHVTGRDVDARNLMSLALIAQMRIAAGDTTTPTTFRDGDNVDHALTPTQILTMWQESAAFVSALYQASWDIKAMDPIPADYSTDHYWP